MTPEHWRALQRGDIITNRGSGDSYVVHAVLAQFDMVLATRMMVAVNPSEWNKFEKKENA